MASQGWPQALVYLATFLSVVYRLASDQGLGGSDKTVLCKVACWTPERRETRVADLLKRILGLDLGHRSTRISSLGKTQSLHLSSKHDVVHLIPQYKKKSRVSVPQPHC